MIAYMKNGFCCFASFKPEGVVDFVEIDTMPEGEGPFTIKDGAVIKEEHINRPSIDAPLETKIQAQQDRIDFLEDCIAEMASIIYQ